MGNDELIFEKAFFKPMYYTSPVYIDYFYYGANNEILYIGKSKRFYRRHAQHYARDKYTSEIEKVGIREYDNEFGMNVAEVYYIGTMNPKYNRACRVHWHSDSQVSFIDNTEESIISSTFLNQEYFSDNKNSKFYQRLMEKYATLPEYHKTYGKREAYPQIWNEDVRYAAVKYQNADSIIYPELPFNKW